MTRTEEDALPGVLRLTMGGQTRELPTLKLKASRKWKAELGGAIATFDIPDLANAKETFASIANVASDRMLDLVLAYDETHALSGEKTPAANRRWVEEHADDRELYAAFQEMVTATLPFMPGLRSVAEEYGPQIRELVGSLVARLSERSRQASSTPTRSVNGASTRTPSTPVSATSSS